MAVTVTSIESNNGNPKRNTGITTGNEFIYKVNPAQKVQITGLATSTGDAQVFYSNDPIMAAPTDFTTLVASSLGVLTDDLGENLGSGIEWVGVSVTSGTWTVNIKEL